MPRIVVESLNWERIQVIVEGRIEGAEECAGPWKAHVEEARSGLTAEVEHFDVSGTRFRMRFNVMQALERYPLGAGDWNLVVACGAESIAAIMDDAFAIDVRDYPGLFTAGSTRYWLVPTRDQQSHRFRLSVNHRTEPSASKSTLRRRMAVRGKAFRARVFSGLHALIGAFTRHNGRRILFTSDSREKLSGNLAHVYDRMVERGLDREFQLMTIFKRRITEKRSLLDKLKFTYYLAIADVILLDDFQPMIYKVEFAPGVKIIQLWHASGAFKTVGYSRIGKPGGPSPFSAGHKNYTHAIVSSQHDVPYYSEAFGIPERCVVPTGIPRMDVFFDQEYRAAVVEKVLDLFPAMRGRTVYLFAPTFRGVGPSDAYYDYDRIDFDALYALCEAQDAVVVFKMHPFVIEPLVIPQRYRDRFIDAGGHREINDLLFVADVVITDYSSVVFEYSTLGRPMLFFAYDLEEYTSTRDFYGDFSEFVPGRIARTFDEVIEALRTGELEGHKVEEFAHKHFGHLDAGSTDRVIDQLILGS